MASAYIEDPGERRHAHRARGSAAEGVGDCCLLMTDQESMATVCSLKFANVRTCLICLLTLNPFYSTKLSLTGGVIDGATKILLLLLLHCMISSHGNGEAIV